MSYNLRFANLRQLRMRVCTGRSDSDFSAFLEVFHYITDGCKSES